MDQEPRVGLSEFQQALNPQDVRSLQIIQGALGGGSVLFGAVVLWFYGRSTPPGQDDFDAVFTMQILTAVHAILAVVEYSVAAFLYGSFVSRRHLSRPGIAERLDATLSQLEPPQRCLALIRVGTIMRLAMFQGVAFLGLTVCLLGSIWGVLKAHPIFWVNGLSAVAMILLAVTTFPTKERLEAVFRRRFSDRH